LVAEVSESLGLTEALSVAMASTNKRAVVTTVARSWSISP